MYNTCSGVANLENVFASFSVYSWKVAVLVITIIIMIDFFLKRKKECISIPSSFSGEGTVIHK